jgi:hypothetical protein
VDRATISVITVSQEIPAANLARLGSTETRETTGPTALNGTIGIASTLIDDRLTALETPGDRRGPNSSLVILRGMTETDLSATAVAEAVMSRPRRRRPLCLLLPQHHQPLLPQIPPSTPAAYITFKRSRRRAGLHKASIRSLSPPRDVVSHPLMSRTSTQSARHGLKRPRKAALLSATMHTTVRGTSHLVAVDEQSRISLQLNRRTILDLRRALMPQMFEPRPGILATGPRCLVVSVVNGRSTGPTRGDPVRGKATTALEITPSRGLPHVMTTTTARTRSQATVGLTLSSR